jgi:NitT/TauT family transport system substrate-binding protein
MLRLGRIAFAAAVGALLCTASAQAQTTVRIANFQNTVALGLYHAIDKGYFKEAGLDVELIKVASGAASVQAVASGQADVGWAATAVPMFARSNGVKIKMFMTVDQEGPPDHYGTFYIASGKSGVTVPFPQMPAALELGNGDVVCTIQPMAAAILANKTTNAKTLDKGTIMASAKRPVTASAYFATDEWIAKNEKTALAFGRAFLRAQKEIHADPKLRIDLVMKIGGMERAVAETIPEAWFETLSVKKESAEPNYEALVKTGMLKTQFPIDDVIATLPY